MGKVIKKKLNGMSWWMKTSLILLLTMATTMFMYQGWYKPAKSYAAAVRYDVWPGATTSVGTDGSTTMNTAVGTASTLTATATANTARSMLMSGQTLATNIRNRFTGVVTSTAGWEYFRSYTPASTTSNNVIAASVPISVGYYVRAAGSGTAQIIAELYEYNDTTGVVGAVKGTFTSTAFSITAATTGASATGTFNNSAFTMTAGNRLEVRFFVKPSVAQTVGDVAILWGSSTSTTPSGSTYITPTESGGATGGTLAVSATTQSVSEGVVNASISVTRVGGSTGAVTVDYTTADGTALAGADYTSTIGTLSWADGDTAAKTITVPIIDDTTDETDETFTVTLSNATNGATLGTATQTVTITDNDVPTVQFQSATSSGSESTTPALINVTLSVAPVSNVTVNYSTTNGTATAGSDYTATSGTLTITAPATSGQISVPIINDSTQESSETFTVTLSSPSANAALGTTTVHTYTINDDDGPVATISSCTQCHNGYPSLTDAATRNGSPGAFPGSHSVGDHGTDCTVCHVSNTLFDHSNGTIEMAASINGGTYGKGSSWAATNTPTTTPASLISCSATSCHGTISPAWGSAGAGGCVTCHSPDTATSSFKITAGTTDTAKSTIHVSHLNKSHNMRSAAFACTECHIAVSSFSDPGHITGQLPASVTMGSDLAKGLPKLAATPLSPSFNGTACSNTWCHGAGLASNTTPPAGVVLSPTFGTTLLTGIASNDCGKCHGYPPQSSDHIKTAPSTYYVASECKSCHPHVLSDGSGFETTGAETIAKHIDGNIDASGGSCTGCHKSGGNGDKNGRTAVTEQFNTAGNSHHVQSGTAAVDVKACYACHWEANSDGSVNTTYHTKNANQPVSLVVWNATTRPTTYTLNTTAVEYLSGGTAASTRAELTKISAQCTGCHNATNKTTAPFTAAGDTSTTSKYAWDAVDINTKWIQAGTTPWGKFNFAGTTATGRGEIGGTNKKSTVTKAFSAHNNASGNAMSGSATTDVAITNISGGTAVLCYDCHNSHGSSVAGVTSQYSSATGRNKGGLIKDVTGGKGGYVATYKPVGHTAGTPANNKATSAAGATLCFDCHNSSAGTLTAGYNDSGTAPWGYTTFGASQALNGYFDTPYFGAFTVPSASRVWSTTTEGTNYKAGTANAKAQPVGGHFGASSAMGTTITTQSFPNGVQNGVQGLCTPCHDPHGVTTNTAYLNGAVGNQQYAVPLLKGTWLTSPYKEDKADIAVKRGGGSRFAGITGGGAIPGYHIDQNTLVAQPAALNGGAAATTTSTNQRAQSFASFGTSASTQQTVTDLNFAGLCNQCHLKTSLRTDTLGAWKSTARIHQSVKGWASTTAVGTNTNNGNVIHAYTCSKCHAPHTSRLPRLMVTNCLDVNHYKQAITGGTISSATPTTATSGNIWQSAATSGKGAGRFPGGGTDYIATVSGQNQNIGPWWFAPTPRTTSGTRTDGAAANYGSNCHNATRAGGTAYNPTNQQWNTKTPW